VSRSSAAQDAGFVSAQIYTAGPRRVLSPAVFVVRALDWLRAAMNMLLETWGRRL
jgi:hypothetical protein